MTDLKGIVSRAAALPEDRRQEVVADALAATADMKWLPLPGPQTEAYFSPADILLYGGEAGGSKSDLLLGLAFTAHQRSLLCRRQYTDLGALTARAIQINGTRAGFNGAPPAKLLTTDGRLLEFFAAHQIGDEQRRQGQPVDLLGVDEAAQFAWRQIQLMLGWNRSVDPNQRCRAVLATNPPISSEGAWLVEEFAPWLDPAHPDPAKPGELRWYISDEDGRSVEVESPEEREIAGHIVKPLSRTFIPAGLKDNPFLSRTQYKTRLDNLPAEYRAAFRDGDFSASRQDDPQSLFPMAWLRATQERWQPVPPPEVPMCAIGVDVAQGGLDDTVLAPRYDGYYPNLIVVPGKKTPDGSSAAALVIQHRRNGAVPVIDMCGGYGMACWERLRDNQIEAVKFKGAETSTGRSKDGREPFANKRAEVYWRFREALDPDQPGGSSISLPPDSKLISQLAAVRFEVGGRGIELEPKEELTKRLGRSPDRADAVVMAWYRGTVGSLQRQMWGYGSGPYDKPLPKVIRSRAAKRRRR
jgi:hypothetical protein